jgi:hypothetical protein
MGAGRTEDVIQSCQSCNEKWHGTHARETLCGYRPQRTPPQPGSGDCSKSTRNQRREPKAVADRHGWQIFKIYEDAGISGAQAAMVAPGSMMSLMKAVARREFDMVAEWWVDRLGLSPLDLLGLLRMWTCSCTSKASISGRAMFRCSAFSLSGA